MGNFESYVSLIARSIERALDLYLNALEEPAVYTLKEANEQNPYSVDYLSILVRKGRIAAFKKGNQCIPVCLVAFYCDESR